MFWATERMQAQAPAKTTEKLSDSQRSALISLLGDEDPAVYDTVRAKLISFGYEIIDWLRPCTISNDPLLRRRAMRIIESLERKTADEYFLTFCVSRGEDLPLEQGAWKLAQTQYPEINVGAYEALLDAWAAVLRTRINFAGDAEEVLEAFNRYLFHELNFAPNEANYYDPDNSYLNRVMDKRTGNPISLCTIYLLVARRLKLPVTGIGLPGHFVCRYQTSTAEVYVDAFNRGKLLTKADCIKYLLHTHHGLEEGYLAPVTPRRILLRMCANLHQIYLHNEQADETARFQRYLVALAK
jgi:regulator of sirC expression with transglutaminase-like and TPR domain